MVIRSIFLCITSGWAFQNTPVKFKIMKGAFIFFFAHGIASIVSSEESRLAYRTAFIADKIHLPLLNAGLYGLIGEYEMSYIHFILAGLPLLCSFTPIRCSQTLTESVELINLVSHFYLFFLSENITHLFVVMNELFFKYQNGNAEDLALGLSLFNILAVNLLHTFKMIVKVVI